MGPPPVPDPKAITISFLFIANEMPANDEPGVRGSVEARCDELGYWTPPEESRGFYAHQPGNVYRWRDSVVTAAVGYDWRHGLGDPTYTRGTIARFDGCEYLIPPLCIDIHWLDIFNQALTFESLSSADHPYKSDSYSEVQPVYYNSATAFFCSRLLCYRIAQGDASTRNISDLEQWGPEWAWFPLRFWWGPEDNIAHVDYVGEDTVTVKRASWIKQLIPGRYRAAEQPAWGGGLGGLLPLVVALVAFSCPKTELDHVLRVSRSWQVYRWVPHRKDTGRKSARRRFPRTLLTS